MGVADYIPFDIFSSEEEVETPRGKKLHDLALTLYRSIEAGRIPKSDLENEIKRIDHHFDLDFGPKEVKAMG